MKPGTKITLKNLPKDNGRAQLWIVKFKSESFEEHGFCRLRILTPDGNCFYKEEGCLSDYKFWFKACFVENVFHKNIKAVQKIARKYDRDKDLESYFGGYL